MEWRVHLSEAKHNRSALTSQQLNQRNLWPAFTHDLRASHQQWCERSRRVRGGAAATRCTTANTARGRSSGAKRTLPPASRSPDNLRCNRPHQERPVPPRLRTYRPDFQTRLLASRCRERSSRRRGNALRARLREVEGCSADAGAVIDGRSKVALIGDARPHIAARAAN